MDKKIEIIKKVKNNAQTVLNMPLKFFLASTAMDIMHGYLETEKYADLYKFIESIYNLARIITTDSFEGYSLEALNDIDLLASKLFLNISHLEEIAKYKPAKGTEYATKLLETIKSNYKNLDNELQKRFHERIYSDDNIRIDQSQERNQAQDIYTEAERDQASKAIKALVNEQLKTQIDELLKTGAIRNFIKRVENKKTETRISSGHSSRVLRKSYAVLWIISLSSLRYFTIKSFNTIMVKAHELTLLLRKITEFEFQNEPSNSDEAAKTILQTEGVLNSITSEFDFCITYLMHEIFIEPDMLPALVKFNESRAESEKLNNQVKSIMSLLEEKNIAMEKSINEESKKLNNQVKSILSLLEEKNIAMAKSINEESKKLNNQAKSTMSLLEEKNIAMEKSILELRDIGLSIATNSHTEIFASRSKKFKFASWRWLFLAAMSALLAIVAAWHLLHLENAQVDPMAAFIEIPLRVVILGILISAAIWCGRNYRSLAHQSVANTEREDILRTFHFFMDGAYDKKVQDLVLAEAIRSVFTPSPSGFVDHATGRDSHGPINLTNSAKTIEKLREGE